MATIREGNYNSIYSGVSQNRSGAGCLAPTFDWAPNNLLPMLKHNYCSVELVSEAYPLLTKP